MDDGTRADRLTKENKFKKKPKNDHKSFEYEFMCVFVC